MPQRWALIVSISVYEVWGSLPGAEADGKNVVDFLTMKLDIPVPSDHIRHLANADATRRGIISAFKAHLIQNQDIQRGDAILFYFSGHGTRLKAPIGWTVVGEGEKRNGVDDSGLQADTEQNDMIEAIVPYDESVQYDGDDHATCAIPDRTLAALLKSAAHEHGNNITVVLDCCHSGHGTRSNTTDLLHGQELTVRALPGSRLSPLSPNLDNDLSLATQDDPEEMDTISDRLSPSLDYDLATVTRQVPFDKLNTSSAWKRGALRALVANHVLIAACKPNELAFCGSEGGILTTLWLDGMKKSPYPRTHARVMKYIHKQLSAVCREAWPQHPQCEGIYRDRLVFEEMMMKADHFNVNFSRGGLLTVDAGEVNGVQRGTTFEIYELSKSLEEPKVCDAEAQEVYSQTSILRAKSAHSFQHDTVYTAAMIHEVQLRYAIVGLTSTQSNHILERLHASLSETPSVIEVPTEVDADLTLCLGIDGSIVLRRLDPVLRTLDPRNSTPLLSHEEVARADFDKIMRGIAKFNWLLCLHNPARPLASLITFRMLRFKKRDDEDEMDDGIFIIREGDGDPVEITEDGAQVDDNHEYAIILENHSKSDLHVQVWYLDPDDYSIKNLYEPMNDEQPTLLAKQADSGSAGRLQIGASTEHEWPLRYFAPATTTRTTLYAMVFLTTKSARLGSLDQDPLFGPDAVDDRTIAQGEVDTDGLWDVIRRPIAVTKV